MALQRPAQLAWPYLNPHSPLYQGLVFAGLGPHPGGYDFHDCSVYGNRGTLTNMDPSTDWKWSPELGRWVLDFDAAASQYVNLGDLTALFGSDASVSAWIRLDADPPAAVASSGIWDLGTYSSAEHYPYTDGNIYLGTFRDDRPSLGAGLLADLTVWHHLAITQQPGANNWICYQNGEVAATLEGESQVYFPSGALLGGDTVNARYLAGQMSDVCLHNRVLTPAEISALADRSNVMLGVPNGQDLILPPGRKSYPAAVAGATTFVPYPYPRRSLTGGLAT